MSAQIFRNIVRVSLSEGSKVSDVEVLRVGIIQDRDWEVTDKMLNEYVLNFKNNVYGTEIQVNLEHNRGSAAAGWIKDLYVKNHALFATVEWTELGVENITKNLFKFVSAELASGYPHHETGKEFDNVFIGLALTNTPALKGQSPIALSERQKQLSNKRMLKTLLEEMQKRSFVSAADKQLVKKLLEEAPADEKEANKAAVDEIDKKPEAPELTPEEKAAKEAADKKAVEDANVAKGLNPDGSAKSTESLKEKVDVQKFQEMEREVTQLREEAKRNKVTALAETFMVSEHNRTGFAGTAKVELTEFLMTLSEEGQAKFGTLMKKVSTVDLKTLGGKGVKASEDDEDKEDFIEKRAKELVGKEGKDGKKMDIGEAQKCAAEEWAAKNK